MREHLEVISSFSRSMPDFERSLKFHIQCQQITQQRAHLGGRQDTNEQWSFLVSANIFTGLAPMHLKHSVV